MTTRTTSTTCCGAWRRRASHGLARGLLAHHPVERGGAGHRARARRIPGGASARRFPLPETHRLLTGLGGTRRPTPFGHPRDSLRPSSPLTACVLSAPRRPPAPPT